MSVWQRVRDAWWRSQARKDEAALEAAFERLRIQEDEHQGQAANGNSLPPHYEEVSQPRIPPGPLFPPH